MTKLKINEILVSKAVDYILNADKPSIRGLCRYIDINHAQYYRWRSLGWSHISRRKNSPQRWFAEETERAWKLRGKVDAEGRASGSSLPKGTSGSRPRTRPAPPQKPSWGDGEVPLSELRPEHFKNAYWRHPPEKITKDTPFDERVFPWPLEMLRDKARELGKRAERRVGIIRNEEN